MFEIDPTRRINLKDLRRMVKGVSRWTMTEEELACAHDAARKAAEASGSPAAERLRVRQAKAEEERRLVSLPSPSHTRLPLTFCFFRRRQEAASALAAAHAAFSVPPPALVNVRAVREQAFLASPFSSRSGSHNPYPYDVDQVEDAEEEDAPWHRGSVSSSAGTTSTYAASEAVSYGDSRSPAASSVAHPALRRPAQIYVHTASDAISERRVSSTSSKAQSPSAHFTFGHARPKYLSPPPSPLRPNFVVVPHPAGARYAAATSGGTTSSSFGTSASSSAPATPEMWPVQDLASKQQQRPNKPLTPMDIDEASFLSLPSLDASTISRQREPSPAR